MVKKIMFSEIKCNLCVANDIYWTQYEYLKHNMMKFAIVEVLLRKNKKNVFFYVMECFYLGSKYIDINVIVNGYL